MRVTDCQRLLSENNFYDGGLDNDWGPKTQKAIDSYVLKNSLDLSKIKKSRHLVAVSQHLLNSLDFEAGSVDGLVGHNTREAFSAWEYWSIHGKREEVSRIPTQKANPTNVLDMNLIPRQSECPSFYGRTKEEVERNLVRITLPFHFRIDYDLRSTTNKLRVHKKCAKRFLDAWTEVYNTYGIEKMRKLGIDRNAGTFNWRKMRGGSKLSMHSYGCAQDVYAAPNGLRMRCPKALFCKPEYKKFLDIMEKHGCLPAIRLWGADAMHFQVARM